MLKNYMKIAVRNLQRYKLYSCINIFGLSTGIACCILILLYVNSELSYDGFHQNANRIYRINTDLKFGSRVLALPVVTDMMGPLLKKDYPQVEEYTRIYSFDTKKLVKMGSSFNVEQKIAFVDSTFFRVFTFAFVSGNTNPNGVILNEPNTVVITESIARKYFGTAYAEGKVIETNDNGSTAYKVTGVIKDMPDNSHFRFDFLFPMQNLDYRWGNLASSNFYTFLLLKEGTNPKEFEKNFVNFSKKYVFPYMKDLLRLSSKEEFEKAGNRYVHSLIPIKDIHLYSKRIQEISPTGSIQYVYIFSAVALFILLIACINFMNLTTARSANRAREVGIRKVLGTERKNLVFQFLTESTLMSSLAVLFAVMIVSYILPYFSNLSGKNLTDKDLFSSPIIYLLILLPFAIGVTAGFYPAFFLSRFMPSEIMKGKLSKINRNSKLRSTLVVFQFATSVILITGTIIIYSQLSYIQSKNLGYQKDQVLIINNASALGNNIDAFKEGVLKVPGVISGTISSFIPTPSERSNTAFAREASQISKGGLTMQRWIIDYDYLGSFGIRLSQGRNFSEEFGTDSSAIILNETAVRELGFDNDPINERVYSWSRNGKITSHSIIGVVKDFNFESLHQDIGPLCLILGKSTGLCSFKVNAANISAIIRTAEDNWRNLSPGLPFSFDFMDESFNDVYKAEKRVGVLALLFSALAIIVAGLGLFGLATFMTEQRTKEIGIRKVLGASISTILMMLSKEFLKWIVIANVIAWPIAYYFMNKWLQDFAFRIDISIWMFVISGTAALVIALATVSFQAVKAAIADPVKSLKYE